MKTFQKTDVRELRDKLNIALKAVAKDMGIDAIEIGGIRYSDFSCTMKLNATLKGQTVADNKTQNAKNELYISLWDLPVDTIGRQFVSGRQTFIIDRLDPRKREYPILAHDIKTNGQYKFSVEQIKLHLK